MQARIAALWRFPVKSCAGEPVQTLTLDAQGWPLGDRGWAVANAAGELTWMDEHPGLTQVQAQHPADGDLVLTADGSPPCRLAAGAGRATTLLIWNQALQQHQRYVGWDAGDEAAAMLQRATGAALRLARLSAAARSRQGAQALHVLSQASLDAWRQACPGIQMRARRARANVLLSPVDEDLEFPPFLEDQLMGLRAPQARLGPATPCVRCVVPAIDPVIVTQDERATAALAQLSAARAPGEPVRFGVYLRGLGAGCLRVGDRVELDLSF